MLMEMNPMSKLRPTVYSTYANDRRRVGWMRVKKRSLELLIFFCVFCFGDKYEQQIGVDL